MKSSIVYAAAGLGSVSLVGGVAYAVKSVLGLGGTTGLAFSQNALDSPRSIPEPETFLLLRAGLLGLCIVAPKVNSSTPVEVILRNGFSLHRTDY